MADYLYEQPIKPLSDDGKKALTNRLKRIEGQVRGIQKMVEADRYCIDVLVQISAIQAALHKVALSIAEDHMKHCVTHAISTGDGEKAIAEVIDLMKHFTR